MSVGFRSELPANRGLSRSYKRRHRSQAQESSDHAVDPALVRPGFVALQVRNGLGERRARGDEQVARDGSQYTCFAVVAVLGSQRFDTIGIVPDRERRRATASLLHS